VLELRPKTTLKTEINSTCVINEVIESRSSFYKIIRIMSYVFRVFNGIRVDRATRAPTIVHIPSNERTGTFIVSCQSFKFQIVAQKSIALRRTVCFPQIYSN